MAGMIPIRVTGKKEGVIQSGPPYTSITRSAHHGPKKYRPQFGFVSAGGVTPMRKSLKTWPVVLTVPWEWGLLAPQTHENNYRLPSDRQNVAADCSRPGFPTPGNSRAYPCSPLSLQPRGEFTGFGQVNHRALLIDGSFFMASRASGVGAASRFRIPIASPPA